jgi:hypothetical protein
MTEWVGLKVRNRNRSYSAPIPPFRKSGCGIERERLGDFIPFRTWGADEMKFLMRALFRIPRILGLGWRGLSPG